MTNADKYLKDGVTIEDFEDIYHDWLIKDIVLEPEREMQLNKLDSVMRFLRTPAKPVLTEDERVILMNLHYEKGAYEYERIGRTRKDSEGYSDLYLIEKDLTITNFNEYIHLFQFIKERRRILY